MDKHELLASSIRYLRDFYGDYSFNRFLPLFHGTSTYHYAQMFASGYLSPRGDRPSTWDFEGQSASRKGLVYFASFLETMIPNRSAQNAVRQAKRISEWMYRGSEVPTDENALKRLGEYGMKPIPFDFEKGLAEIYLMLPELGKYRRSMARDEDESFKWFLDRSIYGRPGSHSDTVGTFCSPSVDWQLVVVLDCACFFFGRDKEVLERIVSTIPPEVLSFYSNDTVAFSSPIRSSDLRSFSREDFYKICSEAREKSENACYNPGERDLKYGYANGRVSEQQFRDFVESVQIPRLKSVLASKCS